MVQKENPIQNFDLYRYQLLPITRNVQLDLLRGIESINSLKERKNEFFAEILSNLPPLRHRNIQIIHRLDMHTGDWFVFHVAAKKTLERSRPDFRKERLEDWPHVIVIINNSRNTQAIAISRNVKAFSSSFAVASLLRANLQPALKTYQLHFDVEALFEKQTFWSLVREYQGRITSVTFELVSPNMANISKTLEIDLEQINAETNSHRTDLRLNSGEGSALEIDEKNKIVNSLVDYAAAGGGDILIRVKGVKKTIRTSRNVSEVAIDEIVLKNPTAESLQFIEELFGDKQDQRGMLLFGVRIRSGLCQHLA